MDFPAAGEPYRVWLDGGPLDGERRTLISEGGLNRVAEFQVGDTTARYLGSGDGHDANGQQTWRYVHIE